MGYVSKKTANPLKAGVGKRSGFLTMLLGLNLVLVATAGYCYSARADSFVIWNQKHQERIAHNLHHILIDAEYREMVGECRLVLSLIDPPVDNNYRNMVAADPHVLIQDRIERTSLWISACIQEIISYERSMQRHRQRIAALTALLANDRTQSLDHLNNMVRALPIPTIEEEMEYSRGTAALINAQTTPIIKALDNMRSRILP